MADQVWTWARITAMLQSEFEAGTLRAFLFDNDVTPSNASIYSDFHEALDPVDSHPLEWSLHPGSWTYTNITGGVQAAYPQQSDTVHGPLSIYGFAIVDASNVLKVAQRWAGAPVTLPTGSNALQWTPATEGDSP